MKNRILLCSVFVSLITYSCLPILYSPTDSHVEAVENENEVVVGGVIQSNGFLGALTSGDGPQMAVKSTWSPKENLGLSLRYNQSLFASADDYVRDMALGVGYYERLNPKVFFQVYFQTEIGARDVDYFILNEEYQAKTRQRSFLFTPYFEVEEGFLKVGLGLPFRLMNFYNYNLEETETDLEQTLSRDHFLLEPTLRLKYTYKPVDLYLAGLYSYDMYQTDLLFSHFKLMVGMNYRFSTTQKSKNGSKKSR